MNWDTFQTDGRIRKDCPRGRNPNNLGCLPPAAYLRGYKLPTDKELIEDAAEFYVDDYRKVVAARDIVNGLVSLVETATAPAFALSSKYLPWF